MTDFCEAPNGSCRLRHNTARGEHAKGVDTRILKANPAASIIPSVARDLLCVRSLLPSPLIIRFVGWSGPLSRLPPPVGIVPFLCFSNFYFPISSLYFPPRLPQLSFSAPC